MIDIPIPREPIAPRRPLLIRDTGRNYILRIDNTSLETFQTCARKSEYYLVHRRQAPPAAALAFGAALHTGLEHYYKEKFKGNIITAAEDSIKKAVDEYQSFPCPQDEWRTVAHLGFVLSKYFDHYDLTDFSPISLPTDEPAVEIPFSLQLGHIDINGPIAFPTNLLVDDADEREPLYIDRLYIFWTGKIDLVVSHMSDLAITDHKTTSIAGPQFFDQFRLSQPVHGYAWATEQILKQPVNKFLLNAIIMRKPTKTGTSLEFDRRPYHLSPAMLAEWKRDVLDEIARFVDQLTHGYFPKSPVWCMGKYGKCPYHDVCIMPPDTRHAILNSDLYTNVTWSPLSKD